MLSDDIEKLRDQIDGKNSEEQDRLDQTEKVLKRALLTKTLGDNPAMLMLRQTLAHRIDLCQRYIIQMAKNLPLDSDGVLRHAVETNTVATRMADYEWFLKLFTNAEARIAVINKDRGESKRK